MTDPRPAIFAGISSHTATAAVTAADAGIVTQTDTAAATAAELGLTIEHHLADGARVTPGDEILRFTGSPLQVALAEERLIGILAKPSGIATATRGFIDRADGRLRIVSGAWKKLPFAHKDMIRSAIVSGGAHPRIAEWPFAYLDKNFVTMLGGVAPTLAAVAAQPDLAGFRRIIQVTTAAQACIAAQAGADIVFVDTGIVTDAERAAVALRDAGLRDRVELAFGGGVQLGDIDDLAAAGVDIADIGRAIVDAPLLDMSVRVISISAEEAA